MKKELPWRLITIALGGALLTGCYVKHTKTYHEPVVVAPTGQVYVPEQPPAPREEVAGAAPSPGAVWVGGYWTYVDGRWVWIPGHWQAPPRPGATYENGHWDHTSRGWVWTPGHWD